jgi:hypothetical protein
MAQQLPPTEVQRYKKLVLPLSANEALDRLANDA